MFGNGKDRKIILIGDNGRTEAIKGEAIDRRAAKLHDSERNVVTETEILAVPCTTCNTLVGLVCKNKERHVLTYHEDSTEFAFHRSRVLTALAKQTEIRFPGIINIDRFMICYYAFVMMSNSIAENSEKLMGKKFTPDEIEKFFASKAIQELNRDKILG